MEAELLLKVKPKKAGWLISHSISWIEYQTIQNILVFLTFSQISCFVHKVFQWTTVQWPGILCKIKFQMLCNTTFKFNIEYFTSNAPLPLPSPLLHCIHIASSAPSSTGPAPAVLPVLHWASLSSWQDLAARSLCTSLAGTASKSKNFNQWNFQQTKSISEYIYFIFVWICWGHMNKFSPLSTMLLKAWFVEF